MDEYLYKVLVVGESGCGKTSLIRREVHNVFQMNCKTTIGVDFALKVIKTGDVNVTLQIWDIAGQEQFGHLTRVYYQAAVGALVVFDVTRGATFEKAVEWKKDIDNKVFLPDGSPLPCLLVANKCDLPWAKQPTNEEMNAFCAKHKFIGWIETSPKENINVDKCFRRLVEKVVENDQNIDQNVQQDMSSVRLDPRHNRPEDKPKSRCKC